MILVHSVQGVLNIRVLYFVLNLKLSLQTSNQQIFAVALATCGGAQVRIAQCIPFHRVHEHVDHHVYRLYCF